MRRRAPRRPPGLHGRRRRHGGGPRDQGCQEDTDLEEGVEGDHLEGERDEVPGEERGEDGAGEEGVAAVATELGGRDDPEADGGEDRDGDLEDDAHGEENGGCEAVVLAGLDEGVELGGVEVLEEADPGGEDDEVAEGGAEEEEEGDGGEEGQGEASLTRVEGGEDEAVELEEDDGEGEDEGEVEGDGEGAREGLADPEGDGLFALGGGGDLREVGPEGGEASEEAGARGGREAARGEGEEAGDGFGLVAEPQEPLLGEGGLSEGAFPSEDLRAGLTVEGGVDEAQEGVVLPEAEPEGEGEGDSADEEAGAELLEVVDEAEALFVADCSDRGGHLVK